MREDQGDGTYIMVNKRNNVYIDQILNDGNKKDVLAVIALIEAALATVLVEFPHINEVSIQSDNAGCYQGILIILTVNYLNLKFTGKIFIIEIN